MRLLRCPVWKAFLVPLLALTATGQPALAADTAENFDIGATDFELYLGFDGIGKDKYQKEVSAEALAGFGFVDGFSGYIAAAGSSNEYFAEGSAELSVGIFGTPLDTGPVDLDLFLNLGAGADHFEVTPALELNLDLEPDLQFAGLYLRVEETLAGRRESPEDEPNPEYALAPQTGLVIGANWTFLADNQLLLEYDLGLLHNPAAGERRMEMGGIALGYNVMVADELELLSQLFVDIPRKDEDLSAGLMVGLISTMAGD